MKNVEGSYLMLSEGEVNLLLRNELVHLKRDLPENCELLRFLDEEVPNEGPEDEHMKVEGKFDHLKQDFRQMNFGVDKYEFKKEARRLKKIGPLHFMILKLEESTEYDDRISLIRNIESMIRLPRPMV